MATSVVVLRSVGSVGGTRCVPKDVARIFIRADGEFDVTNDDSGGVVA